MHIYSHNNFGIMDIYTFEYCILLYMTIPPDHYIFFEFGFENTVAWVNNNSLYMVL